jgi:hypothetical protein
MGERSEDRLFLILLKKFSRKQKIRTQMAYNGSNCLPPVGCAILPDPVSKSILTPVPPAPRVPPVAVIALPVAVAPLVFPEVSVELAPLLLNLAAAVS